MKISTFTVQIPHGILVSFVGLCRKMFCKVTTSLKLLKFQIFK